MWFEFKTEKVDQLYQFQTQLFPVTQNFQKAAENYARAAYDNNEQAIYYLGLMLAYGRGFAPDYAKALMQFQKVKKWLTKW